MSNFEENIYILTNPHRVVEEISIFKYDYLPLGRNKSCSKKTVEYLFFFLFIIKIIV